MDRLSGLHLLLTYKCNYECDHCFTWGSPWQEGTMQISGVRSILGQAQAYTGVEWIYFEGGEPFLYYPLLLQGVREANGLGFKVGIVTNAYWASSTEDALLWLRPLQGLVQDLSVSSDLYHSPQKISANLKHARAAAEQLELPLATLTIAQPENGSGVEVSGQLPEGESGVMYRGRAAEKLVSRAQRYVHWETLDSCPHEDFIEPGRLHIDPLGNVHICQGISLGNLFSSSLKTILSTYIPQEHPVIGPLLAGGPAQLVRQYDVPHQEQYCDACHLCDRTRHQLRQRFADILTPDQSYGVNL